MPIRLNDYRELDQQTIHFDFGEAGDLNVTFAPNALSKDAGTRADMAASSGDSVAALDIFLETVRSWDLQDADGDVLPLTTENVALLGLGTVQQILLHIREYAASADPKADSRTSVSKATSLPTPLRATTKKT